MKFLNPTIDLTFKKIFGTESTKDILISFLNGVLERKEGERITTVNIKDPHNHPTIMTSKRPVVDLKCEDEKNNNYIIEMQVVNQSDYAERCQYYVSEEIAKQLASGEEYKKITPVIFIGVLKFEMFENSEYLSHHKILNIKTLENNLKLAQYHFIELPKFNKEIDSLENIIDQWTFFLKEAESLEMIPEQLKENKAIVHAFKILETSNYSRAELDAYNRLIDDLRTEKSRISGALEEKRIEIAKKLLEFNVALDIIIKSTGLTKEEIEKIKKLK